MSGVDRTADGALTTLASLVLENGRAWGEVAASWQWADAEAVLSGTQRLAYLTRPRGASKTTDLAGIGLAALLEQLPPMSRSYAVASDRDQAGLLLDAIAGFATRTAHIGGRVRIEAWKVTNKDTGATLEILPADAASAYGLRPHLLIVDERAAWKTTAEPERLWRALFSALPKVPTSRLVVITSAGDPAHPAGKLLARVRNDPAWYVSELPGPCQWASDADLLQQRKELPEWEYARLHLNRWVASADRLTNPDAIRQCVSLDGELEARRGVRYVVALDLGRVKDRAVMAVCHGEREGDQTRVYLDKMLVWEGSRERPVDFSIVERYVRHAAHTYNRATVFFDRWQGLQMSDNLARDRIAVVEAKMSPQAISQRTLALHQLITDRMLALPDDAELLTELARVRILEPSPGVYRIDHAHGDHDDRAVALAMAGWWLLNERPKRVLVADPFAGSDALDVQRSMVRPIA